ncbi:MAG: hypothetical protein ACRC62_36970 [Microcoleus sp.]
MAVGFAVKPSKAKAARELDKKIAHFVRLGKQNFPIDLMRWFAAQLDGEQLGPSEDYGVPFQGNAWVSVEQYKAWPRNLRSVICFDEFWDYVDPELPTDKVLDLVKAFSIAGNDLLFEAMELIDD